MEKAINTMVESIKKSIIRDLNDVYSVKGNKVLNMLLKAYIDFQESERDGVGYIFDINNTDDIKCCIDGGMTSYEIGKLYLGSHNNHLPYFYFGCNYPIPQPINTWNELRMNLVAWLDELLPNVVAYPYAYQSYRDVYTAYVTDVILGLQDTNDSYLSDLDALVELKRKLEEMD
jgi:hypothetical protein